MRAYQLLSGVGQRSRARLTSTELAGLRSQRDWQQLRTAVIAWCEAGFRLVDAAAALHIHRNTLVYRIARIEKITGRSMRDYSNCITTYLACLADQLDDASR